MAAQQPGLITDQEELDRLCGSLAAVDAFAFDTEFVGEDQYEPEVCLVQVATDDLCALIDPMSGIDLSRLWSLIADPAIRVIVHAGSEDMSIFRRLANREPAAVFDLQIAAGLIGLGYPTSLARLAKAAAGVTMHKSQTLTNWRRRPLSREQLEYAAADVAHLPRMYRRMLTKLAQRGREAWAIEESTRMCAGAMRASEPLDNHRRLKGAGSLTRRELAIADAILAERDRLARERNRPARTLLRDFLVIEMARRGWTDPAKMATLRGINLPQAALKRLAAAIETALHAPADSHPPAAASREHSEQEEIILSLLTGVLRDHCRRHDIAYSLLATRNDLKEYVHLVLDGGSPAGALLHTGWRCEAVGGLLDAILSGKSAMRIRPHQGQFHVEIE